MQAQGFVRFRVQSGTHDAKIYEVDDLPKLKKTEKHTIDVVIDRVKVNGDIKQRLAESFETALRLADGRAVALEMDSGTEHVFSNKFACNGLRLRCRNWNRACSRSTTRWAPARNATASVTSSSSIRTHRRLPESVAGFGRRQGLGPPQSVLLPDAVESGRVLRIRSRPAV
jgi:hypothetical protein